MTAITEFLFPAPAPPRTREILHWWEQRRLGYNAAVGAAGLFSWVVTSIVLPLSHQHPIPWPIPAMFGIMANVCYCFGPLTELLLRRMFGIRLLPPGPTLFRIGLTFSIGMALLPILMVSFMSVARIVAWLIGA